MYSIPGAGAGGLQALRLVRKTPGSSRVLLLGSPCFDGYLQLSLLEAYFLLVGEVEKDTGWNGVAE
jgi:hypothetical protein